ncbi:MAG: hypothetical protein MUD12_07245 [Spirochaetes bacterium]|jgi:CheY-like chemotaxis protein|nr:hypothetical protein [Spirochaetota bacterium]
MDGISETAEQPEIGARVLLVDDEDIILKFVRGMLIRSGLEVAKVKN